MAVINILKDGTIVDDMSKVTVPKEICEQIYKISARKEVNNNGNGIDLRTTGNT